MNFKKIEVVSFQNPNDRNMVLVNLDHICEIIPGVKVAGKAYDYVAFMQNGQQLALTKTAGEKLMKDLGL